MHPLRNVRQSLPDKRHLLQIRLWERQGRVPLREKNDEIKTNEINKEKES